MTPLSILNSKLNKRLDYLTEGFKRAKASRHVDSRFDQVMKLEGLTSSLWQSWCGFLRSSILQSAIGAHTANGEITTSPFNHLSLDQLRAVSSKFARNQPLPNIILPISGFHQEPTWVDIGKATKIVNGIAPSNKSTILTGIGIVTSGKDVQVVRNAIAHLSSDRIADIKALQLRYLYTSFRHPTDVVFWKEPMTSVDAWAAWIDDYRASAEKVTS